MDTREIICQSGNVFFVPTQVFAGKAGPPNSVIYGKINDYINKDYKVGPPNDSEVGNILTPISLRFMGRK